MHTFAVLICCDLMVQYWPIRLPTVNDCMYVYVSLTLSQWSSSGNPVCLELRPQCTLKCHWINASVLPVVFLCVPIMQINTGTPLGASISQCGSSSIPVYLWLQWSSSVFQLCKLTLGCHSNTTGC